MFRKVLVANRGEIAVRVMRAAEELNIKTVAVYSDADKHAEHVRYADEAYNVGPATASESYLDGEAIVDAALTASADAIHPGYGFLAEDPGFARLVEQTEGLTWIGPGSDAMAALGEKPSARSVMADAGVPIVPGTTDAVSDAEAVYSFAEEHGYPVAIKAAGGGGGRGMKIATEPDEVPEQFAAAQREGEAYFGNDTVYVERYLDAPRHVEIQVLADHHGNVVHLGERDCSLQRRHQKVLEEAPSPAVTPALREEIGTAACRGVAAVDYVNAGTVEFLLDDGEYYFLEVNTRIQVEHPVTEMVTGIDLVKWQLRIAAGEELSIPEGDVDLDGHAMEFRITAEDAADGFAPAAGGTLTTYDRPGGVGVRVDDAISQGDAFVTDYDSLLAKLIVHGEDREEALSRGLRAVDEFDIEGITTTLPFHRLMLTDEQVTAGTHTTDYLDDKVEASRLAEAQKRWGGEELSADEADVRRREFVVEVDGQRFGVELAETTTTTQSATPTPPRPRSGTTASGGETAVTAQLQGTVLDIPVTVGDTVEAGDVVCVIEAMKMENDVIADSGGTVTEIPVAEGETVDPGDTLVRLD